jgi:hypothetical protein
VTAAGIAAKLAAARAAYLAGDQAALEAALDIEPGTPQNVMPPKLSDCTSCGKTDAECHEAIRASGVTRSCCTTCHITDTHPPVGGGGRPRG